MTWFAVCDAASCWFDPACGRGADDPIVRGSLVIETRLPQLRRLKPLLTYTGNGGPPIHFALQALPGGAVSLLLDQAGDILHTVFDCADAGRADALRITYAWDVSAREARISVERTDQDRITLLSCPDPRPIVLRDIEAMMRPGPDRHISSDVLFVAASLSMEPVGPTPTLAPDVPVATPLGHRSAGTLRRGDLVLTASGDAVPVLYALHRTVPARGSLAPVRLRAPYFGLRQDITVASSQKLLVAGSDVEYLFGRESVHLQAGHLLGSAPVLPVASGWLAQYVQLLLPGHETIVAAGSTVESLYAGRIRRRPEHLAASIFAGLDRAHLPEHAPPTIQTLRAFDAVVLTEQLSA